MSDAGDDARETRTEYSRENTFLYADHLGLIQNSAISAEVSRERGYRTVTTKSALRPYGFSDYQCRIPALLMPVYGVRGELVTYQIRPDEPRIDSEDGVMECESGAGERLVIDSPPRCRQQLTDPRITLYVTDGVRKADSAASNGLCCIALLGLCSGRGNGDGIVLPDWQYVALDNRLVRMVYDSDVTEKPEVHAALVRVRRFLQSRGAKVQVVSLKARDGAQ